MTSVAVTLTFMTLCFHQSPSHTYRLVSVCLARATQQNSGTPHNLDLPIFPDPTCRKCRSQISSAKAYTLWLAGHTGVKYRMLTEAEWEYAAKSGSTAVWPWGDEETQICQYGNVFDQSGLTDPRSKIGTNAAATAVACDDGFQTVAPVGQFAPNAFGLYDTIGNVWEWTEDCSVTLYADEPVDGSAWQAPGVCEKRAVRRGSWRTRVSRHRPTFRGRDPANFAYFMFGFRLARDLN